MVLNQNTVRLEIFSVLPMPCMVHCSQAVIHFRDCHSLSITVPIPASFPDHIQIKRSLHVRVKRFYVDRPQLLQRASIFSILRHRSIQEHWSLLAHRTLRIRARKNQLHHLS